MLCNDAFEVALQPCDLCLARDRRVRYRRVDLGSGREIPEVPEATTAVLQEELRH